ncbi:hypothetical protein Dsin_014559 [Dipteronia sinensis]|uniref:MYB transcription factor n=1 Tax=Dipteronia sinensis TaxID=43782 RepID=A0AAE0ANB5_9ROSI|nr:hypothetical protein Dsin_014559 [Dipteronia sinensis]
MGGHRCCSKQKVKKGLWSPEEDEKLLKHITTHGHGSWSSIPKLAGLQRCGKSCRLRWINYLRPDLRRGSFTEEEEQIIIDVHRILGNRWAQIAKHLPGRTDNEVKNFWNSCIKKKLLSQGLDPTTHNLIPCHLRAPNSSNNNKMACNQSNIPVFTLNSQMTSNVPLENIKPPLLPNNYHSTLIQPITTTTTSDYNQNPINNNIVWNNIANNNDCGQNSYDPTSTFPDVISSIEDHQRPISSTSEFELLDDNYYSLWGTTNNYTVEETTFGAPASLDGNQLQQVQNGKVCEMEIEKMNEVVMGIEENINMDSSFDSSSFDLEFAESTLNMSGAICARDDHLISSMDDFAWNF